MSVPLKWFLILIVTLVTLYIGMKLYYEKVVNPRVVEELQNNPDGERAGIAMLLNFEDKQIPVNYLREGDKVFAGADGMWWRSFQKPGVPVTMLIRGNVLTGHGVVVLEDRAYIDDVFSRLCPTVPKWLPDALNGKLIEITLNNQDEQLKEY